VSAGEGEGSGRLGGVRSAQLLQGEGSQPGAAAARAGRGARCSPRNTSRPRVGPPTTHTPAPPRTQVNMAEHKTHLSVRRARAEE